MLKNKKNKSQLCVTAGHPRSISVPPASLFTGAEWAVWTTDVYIYTLPHISVSTYCNLRDVFRCYLYIFARSVPILKRLPPQTPTRGLNHAVPQNVSIKRLCNAEEGKKNEGGEERGLARLRSLNAGSSLMAGMALKRGV